MNGKMTCLFVTASSAACAGEVKVVKDILHNMGIELREVEWLSQDDFEKQISPDTKYDFVYLGAHADGTGFGEKDGATLHAWESLANAICATDCILPGGTLFLACCRGGMKTVALKILTTCQRIDYICGPHWKVTGNDLTAAFQAFVHSRVKKNEEPCKAADRATEACGFKFSCYDREELEAEIETLRKIQETEWEIRSLHAGQNMICDQLAAIAKALNVKLPDPLDGILTPEERKLLESETDNKVSDRVASAP
jgi:hypothetical protein